LVEQLQPASTRDSNLDALVLAGEEVESPRRESIRLRNSVNDINMPMDILVVSYSRFEALREKLGLIYREAIAKAKSCMKVDVRKPGTPQSAVRN
jgi:hypothetical protein